MLETCPACSGFLPPKTTTCPHCGGARLEDERPDVLPCYPHGSLLDNRLVRALLATTVGGAIAVTLMACYGMAPPPVTEAGTPTGSRDGGALPDGGGAADGATH
jgi:hypothetical protein